MSDNTHSSVSAATGAHSAVRKVFRRLIPFAMLLLFFNLIDRTNISFAALQMNQDLGLTPQAYGFAAGVFFLGYCAFEIPSNLMLARVGARRWLARIMISWGLMVLAMAWVSGARSLYVTRFLLGIAEAGLLPGLIYYLAAWVPPPQRALAYSALMSTTALSSFFGGPIATGLMQLEGLGGLRGWQIMFVAESIATVLIGLIVLVALPDAPANASWLDADERHFLKAARAAETSSGAPPTSSLWKVCTDGRVMLGTLLNFFLICCNFGTVYWLPQIVKSLGNPTNLQVGLLTCIPYGLGAVAMLACGQSSDRMADRKWHLTGGSAVAATGYVWAAAATHPVGVFSGLCLATAGIWSTFGVFWAYANDVLRANAAAGGLAFMNSVSTLGGIVAPAMIGVVRQRTHGFGATLLVLALFACVSTLLGLLIERRPSDSARMSSGSSGVHEAGING